MHRRHLLFKQGKVADSPFMTFDAYREKLAEFIDSYHQQLHERVTLGGKRVVPSEEFRRLSTVRYEIPPETVALALLKADSRIVRKGGVMCFRRDWFYRHPALSMVPEGRKVEIRFTERDYRRIWIILSRKEVVEALLVTPTSLLNPNKDTLKAVAQARRQEKKLIDEYQLLVQSQMLGESIEDRANRQSGEVAQTPIIADTRQERNIPRLTRLDRYRLKVASEMKPLIEEIPGELDDPITGTELVRAKVSEFDEEEERSA
jgi:Mu transposase-like protein